MGTIFAYFTGQQILLAGTAICLVTIFYLSLSHSQRDIVTRRLRLSRRRLSSAETPPRSLTPEKEAPIVPNDYAKVFPPSQRDVLSGLAQLKSLEQRRELGDLSFDQAHFESNLLGFEEDFREAEPSKYCYSGFSIQEIKALGDFPDYTTLSGVPLPNAYEEFDIARALPRPYRPLRWGYHQTMSLTKMETDWWIELENTYKDRIAQRKALYAEHGTSVLDWLPGSELACKELMEMVLQFVCARYPQYFSLHPSTEQPGKTLLENRILGTSQIVQEKHPLLVILDTIPEDMVLMIRNPETGYYHFRAGCICSALGWTLGEKLGKQLSEIHAPVPDYKQKMQFSMDRFFTKLSTCNPIQRGSWGLEVDQPLYAPPDSPLISVREHQVGDLTVDRIHLRVDWQTLRRLPLSGAVVFNFKAIFTPITEFRDEPYIPSIILKVMNEGKENLMKYKNTWHTEHVSKPALEEYVREQIASGMIEKDWQVETLAESPFYPGWEQQWKRQQGRT